MSGEAPSRPAEAWDVGHILNVTADYFKKRGIDSPRLDAELLLADALESSRESVLADRERRLTDFELIRYRERVSRRGRRCPVAYILGEKEFYGLPVRVDGRALVPRPDTETLVEAALARMDEGAAVRVLDIGTGTGCIAAALATHRPAARIAATELSADAASLAVENLTALGLLDRVTVYHADLVPQAPLEYDLIVSNPPYLSAEEYAALSEDIRLFEPKQALVGGADGLASYRAILRRAKTCLAAEGRLLLEISPRIAGLLPDIAATSSYRIESILPDLAARPRVAVLQIS